MKLKYRCSAGTPQAVRSYIRSVVEFLESSGAVEAIDVGVIGLLEDALTTRHECIKAIKKEGLTVLDRYGSPKVHPLLATKEKAHNQALSALRELGLTVRSRKDLPDLKEATKEKSDVEAYFESVMKSN